MCAVIATRLSHVKPSATLALNAKVKQLLQEGKAIVNLGVGEPDFDTPAFIKQAAITAINEGFTKYTAVTGIPELKTAIIDKLAKDNGLSYVPQQIIVSTGLKQALFNLLLAVLDPADEVLIPAPYWASYPEMVAITGAIPVIIEGALTNQLKITAQQLQAAITPNTKLLILNSPSNPSGMAYTHEEWRELATVLQAHPNILIASDDMYEKIYWGDTPFVNILNACPELYARTIVFNGVSKTYAMTGWRIGYAAGPATIIEAMELIQSQSTSGANSIAQKAAAAAISGPQEGVVTMAAAYQARHAMVYERLKNIPGVAPLFSTGTFYSFPHVQGLIERLALADDVALCEFLLTEAGVAVLPGSSCGAPGHIRLSFAASLESLNKALDQIEIAINQRLHSHV